MGLHLPGLSFFHNLRHTSHQFAVVGLGRFGRGVCSTLHQLGYEVLGVDQDEQSVAEMLGLHQVSHAIQLDTTEPQALKESGIFEFDTVIVAIGSYIQESIITTLNLKEGGVKQVIAKASSDIHGRVLQKVGADLVIYPEWEMGCYLARKLTKPLILDRFDLDPESSIVEVATPEEFQGKSIQELELRTRFGLNVLAVSQNGKFLINPDPHMPLPKDSVMVVIGSNKDISRVVK
ncbi:MAG: TrkA family potassium uptake protein [Synechococcales cyanobacterium]